MPRRLGDHCVTVNHDCLLYLIEEYLALSKSFCEDFPELTGACDSRMLGKTHLESGQCHLVRWRLKGAKAGGEGCPPACSLSRSLCHLPVMRRAYYTATHSLPS